MSVKMVIGSWGSYNAGNEKALGSKWLDLSNYDTWNEVLEELKKQGFDLDGIDEELFIQDIEGIDVGNTDYANPAEIFNTLKESDCLDDEDKLKVANAYIEVNGWDDFAQRVSEYGDDWDDDIYFYENMTPEEVVEQVIEDTYPDLNFDKLGWLSNYITIDYEGIARDSYEYHEVSNGTIEIR